MGISARPVRELAVAAEARRRGIPVAEPIGAMVEWVAPIVYRGRFLTRALAGMTLWEFLRTDDDAFVRAHVLEQARQVLQHDASAGAFPRRPQSAQSVCNQNMGERFAIAILDLDKAQLFQGPVPARMSARNLTRLRQSVRKLDPEGHYLDSHALALLTRR